MATSEADPFRDGSEPSTVGAPLDVRDVLVPDVDGRTWHERVIEVPVRGAGAPLPLHGIVTTPLHGGDGTVAVILSTGRNVACGPGRIHTELARSWSARGVTTLRVERRGIGVSKLRDPRLRTADPPTLASYEPVQIDDAHEIVEFARRHLGATRLLLLGTCSGAYAALHAAAHGIDAETVVCVNQMIFDNPEWAVDGDDHALAVKARYQLSRTLRDPRRWLTVLRGDIPVGPAIRRLAAYRRIRRGATGAMTANGFVGDIADATPPDLDAMLRTIESHGTRTCFLFDEDDPGCPISGSVPGARSTRSGRGGRSASIRCAALATRSGHWRHAHGWPSASGRSWTGWRRCARPERRSPGPSVVQDRRARRAATLRAARTTFGGWRSTKYLCTWSSMVHTVESPRGNSAELPAVRRSTRLPPEDRTTTPPLMTWTISSVS